jgi:lysyl-tRNA synthetase class 1
MFWADIIANNLKTKAPHIVADGKTPSGKVHVGSLRGVLIHDLIHKSLLSQGSESRYIYYFDDFDPMDGLPIYLDQKKYQKFMGFPLKDIPAPEGSGSFAQFYADDFQKVFERLGVEAEIIYTSSLYEEGKFDNAIRTVLNNAEKIQEIYHKISGSVKKEGWLPFQPVCPKCGKTGTTLATSWDGKEVGFTCETDLVEWAKGCGYNGKISPFGATGKMPWKVEWPSKWLVLGTTVEGAGKDHSSAGGTREVAEAIAREIFEIEPPVNIAYEHILFGGKKMSSSKGLGSSASEVAEILPPEVLRFLFARVPYQRAIDFDPTTPKTIPDLFDEFDRGQKAYFEKTNQDLARTWEASQIGKILEEFNLRFSFIAEQLKNLKSEESVLKEASQLKGKELSDADEKAIKLRVSYAKIWLERFGDSLSEAKTDTKADLSENQKKLLNVLSKELPEEISEDEIQNFIYNKGKDLGLRPMETFQAIYQVLLGKSSGPKAGVLIKDLGVKKTKERFNKHD